MTVSVNGTTGITFNDASTQNTAATGFGFKNRIINGAMMIDQRNAGASVALPDGSSAYSFVTDRWACSRASGTTATGQQSSTAPVGFNNSLVITNGTGITVASSAEAAIIQFIEGFNFADFAWGTVNAQPVTLSFWVRSSLTGTHSGSLANGSFNRCYPFSYTINSANTWEQKSITIAGDTTGTWLTTNGRGVCLVFNNGSGSNFLGTANTWTASVRYGVTGSVALNSVTGSTWFVTGVQLEKGSTATSFDYRPYGTELSLCQRYYQKYTGVNNGYSAFGCGRQTSTTSSRIAATYPTMRAVPTMSYSGVIAMDMPSAGPSVTSLGNQYFSLSSGFIDVNHASGGAVGYGVFFQIQTSSSDFIALAAEL